MHPEIEQYYLHQIEPARSCLLAVREIILGIDSRISEAWKYRMPFFCIEGKMFCYLWTDKKNGEPYVGIVDGKLLDHPALEKGTRARMKILRINPASDLPIRTIRSVLLTALKIRMKNK